MNKSVVNFETDFNNSNHNIYMSSCPHFQKFHKDFRIEFQ